MRFNNAQDAAPGDHPAVGNRAEVRLIVDIHNVRLRESGTAGTAVTIDDLARRGFKTQWPYTLRAGAIVWLTLPGLEPKAARVRWMRGSTVGCEFEEPIHEAVFDHLLRRIAAGR